MPYRFAPLIPDAYLYLTSGLTFVGGLVAQAIPAPNPNAASALNGGTIAAVIVAAITASTPLILRAVDLVRSKEAIRQYRHYARNLEMQLDFKDGENRMLRDTLVRASRKHDFDLPDWFYEEPPEPPRTGDLPILPPIVTPDPDRPSREPHP